MQLRYNQNILVLILDQRIDYTSASAFNSIVDDARKEGFEILELNFLNTKFVTLHGAMFLMFAVTDIIKSKTNQGRFSESRLSNCGESLIVALANFGFIRALKILGNLKVNQNVETLNAKQITFWTKSIWERDYGLNSLYWPVSLIPHKTSYSFEGDVSSFINNFIRYFNLLVVYGVINNESFTKTEILRKDFISAVNEATKNVWDHSGSWGAASIYSSKINGSTFCLFDYGVGFINSYIKRKGEFERNSKNDISTLTWLFEEGNTSDEINNHGKGLKKIAHFVDAMNGKLLIKTDNYVMEYNKIQGLKIKECGFFQGAQLMINF